MESGSGVVAADWVARVAPPAATMVVSGRILPDGLVDEAMGSTVRLVVREGADTAEMAVDGVCRPTEHLEQLLRMGLDTGTGQTLDHLVAVIRRKQPAAS